LFAPWGFGTARGGARTAVRVVAIDRAAFDRLCAEDPALAGRLAAASYPKEG
jgi:hypothetical protein